MNIEAEKIKVMKMLLETNDKSILQRVSDILLGKEGADWWDEISEEEKEAIRTGMRQAESGEVISHEEAVKKFAKWGLK